MILNDEQHRAMEFIAEVNRGGYRPTGHEINEWRVNPDPKPSRKGKLLQPEIPEVPERRIKVSGHTAMELMLSNAVTGITTNLFAGLNTMNWAGLAGTAEYKTIPGKPGKPAVYGPDKPAEKFLAHLRRLGWIERDNRGRYGLSLLGQALLKANAMEDSGGEDSSVIVLATGDQNLGYGQVLGRIAESGDALVVDGYLGTQELMHILQYTDASRFLISDKLASGRVAELVVQINFALPNSTGATRELRKASFHDRYVIGEHKVYILTASLNGLGKSSMAVLIEMPDAPAGTARAEVEKWWEAGEVAATGITQKALLQVEYEAAARREIRVEDGKYLHDGCDVQHRKQSAAKNCTNGT